MATKSLFIVFWAAIITRNDVSVPDANKMRLVICSRILFYEILFFPKTRDYVATIYELKAFQNG